MKLSTVLQLSFVIAVLSGAAAWSAVPEKTAGWYLARSPHFESYSQSGPERAKALAIRFEELRVFFEQNRVLGLPQVSRPRPALRILEFHTAKEYAAVKIHANADAYYTATTDRDYVVMPIFANDDFRIAAHEYAHSVLHAEGLKLPPWLNEGLAELLSTATIKDRRWEFGGSISNHVDTLRHNAWIPAPDIFDVKSTALRTRAETAIFYAESWALTDLLTAAPEFSPHFEEFVAILGAGTASSAAFSRVYSKTPEEMLTAARQWIRQGGSAKRKLASLPQMTTNIQISPVSESRAQRVIADLFLTNGDWGRAEQVYQELLLQSPGDPELLAPLGVVAFRKGNFQLAAEYWRKALDSGLKDPALCYRYAVLADQVGLASEQIERALEQAIALQPSFDDAHFKLALLKSNQGDYFATVHHLQAMTDVSPERAYGYWSALAYALTELGKRNEAEAASEQAKHFAKSSEERAHADKLAYIAQTEMNVRFERDAEGRLRLVTARVPYGAAKKNPFFEAQDHIETVAGSLQEVQCSEGKLTGFLVVSNGLTLALSVPDPTHVLIKNGPSEFTCGPQSNLNVSVEYATTAKAGQGLLRGLAF